ncbi:MAG: hypothetical protein U5L45_08015 [Saprospiraceae bacterium]|nr:hypothetical protein [Saprospiraceae bacterium]
MTAIATDLGYQTSPIFRLTDHSRVWVYQSNRPFSERERIILTSQINGFVQNWSAHGRELSASGDVLLEQFIVLAVDERQAGASGCSIDKSVNFVKELAAQFNVSLFDRLTFTFIEEGQVKTASSSDFKRLFTEGVIDSDTLVFDNLVSNVADLRAQWLKPLALSWHKRFVK